MTLPRTSRVPIWVFVALAALWIVMSRLGWVSPFTYRFELAPASTAADRGQAYTAALPAVEYEGAHVVVSEGRLEPARPLARVAGLLGWSRVYYYLDGLIARRFPKFATDIAWKPLGPSDQLHDEIRAKGGGRYSVRNGPLYFSASDGTDPRTNGRKYRVEVNAVVPAGVRIGIQAGAILLGSWLLVRYLRARPARGGVLSAVIPGLLVSAVMVALLFATGEIYLRSVKIPFTEVVWPAREHPVAGNTFVPGAEVRHTNHADYWVREKANSFGFLDREPVVPKPPGTFRILVLGDSFVEAAQVPIRKKLQVLLEERLRASQPTRAIDVVAMGYSGTGTSNELSFYEAFGKRLQPDLVIVLMISNDLANNSPVLESVRNGWHPYHSPRLFFEVDAASGGFRRVDIDPAWQAKLMHNPSGDLASDYAARIAILRRDPKLAPGLEGWRYPDDLDMDGMFCATEVPGVFREAEAITQYVFRHFAEVGKRDGFKVLVAAADNVTTLCKGMGAARITSPAGVIDRVRKAAEAASVPFADLYPAVSARGHFMLARFPYDSHWSETGHAWVADALAEHLGRNPHLLTLPR